MPLHGISKHRESCANGCAVDGQVSGLLKGRGFDLGVQQGGVGFLNFPKSIGLMDTDGSSI